MNSSTIPKRYVLNVEGVPNWRADQTAKFSSLGLSDKRSAFFSSLHTGDVIVTYVKGAGFVDVREIAVEGISKLGMKSPYPDGTWPWQVRTRLIACVGLDAALSPSKFPGTRLCAGDWRNRFRQSGVLLHAGDGEVISTAIMKAARLGKIAT